jgi:putative spermidine/putrescine transport system ATP-binding protein
LLLDEPLSNLDVKLREQMRAELHALHRRLNLAVVYVTHDQSEALALSDRIAVVNQGRLEQVGTPVDVYERPSTRFVGDFLGRTVILNGTLRNEGGQSFVDVEGQGRVLAPSDGRFRDGERLRLLSRPEDVTLLSMGETGRNEVVGRIEQVAYMGDHLEYTVSAAGRTVVLPAAKKDRHAIGADVRLAFDPARITILPR